MNQMFYFVFLCLYLLTVQFISGTRVKVEGGQPGNHDVFSAPTQREFNSGHDIVGHSYQNNREFQNNFIHQRRYPEHSSLDRKIYFSSTNQHGYETTNSKPRAETQESPSIIDEIIDLTDYSPYPSALSDTSILKKTSLDVVNKPRPVELELSSIIDDLFESGYIKIEPKILESSQNNYHQPQHIDSSNSDLRLYPVRKSLTKPIDFLRNLPVDPSLMTEVIHGSGVFMNSKTLLNLINRYKKNPFELTRNLFYELIGIQELKTMSVSNRKGRKPIPINIRNTVESFVNSIASPKMSHRMFLDTVSLFLKYLRWEHYGHRTYVGYME